MSKIKFIEEVRQMDIPAKAKAELVMLWHQARTVAEAIITFVQRHRQFAEAVLIGAIMAYAISHIPWIGGFLALCTLVTATAIGVMHELRESIASLFEPFPTYA